MATALRLLSILGRRTKGIRFRELLKADKLKASMEPDLDEGVQPETYYAAKKLSYEILACDGQVTAIFIYVERADGYSPFPARLPFLLQPKMTRLEVMDLLGKPKSSGKADVDEILGPQGAWDRFMIATIAVHVEYSIRGNRLARITLMTADSAP